MGIRVEPPYPQHEPLRSPANATISAPSRTTLPAPTAPPAAQVAHSAPPAKRNPNMLEKWLAAASKSQKSKSGAWEASTSGVVRETQMDCAGRGVCGGTISTDAVSDSSHALASVGMRGQRATIKFKPWKGLLM
ncbi:hypothetical protein BD414DRAFT_478301 [Trametes punicea]|nr:hypothetical protein BD414DRAFT_478301 [Trametes punicea]